MRRAVFLGITSLFLSAAFQVKAALPPPRFRPAVLGSGPDSLVNQLDTQDLLKKGQKDGAIMFCCRVATTGDVVWYRTYLPVPGSDLLEEEVRKRLDSARLAPAIYEHKPVEVLFYGTVFFSVVDGKPRLHIFANQEAAERSEEHTSELQSRPNFVCRLLLEKKKNTTISNTQCS